MGVPDLDLIHILYVTEGGKAVFVCHTVCLSVWLSVSTYNLTKNYEKAFQNLKFISWPLIFKLPFL